MVRCGDEHHGHGHCHGHSHDDDDHLKTEGEQDYLYGVVDRDAVLVLNEHEPNAGKRIIKPWAERNTLETYVESSVDDSLLIRIPFASSSSVKLRTLLLNAGPGEQTPDTVHIFTNSTPPIDFADAADRAALPPKSPQAPAQTLSNVAATNATQVVEYPLRVAKFSRVRDVTLYIPASQGAETTRVYFAGFKGEWEKSSREAPVGIIYESAPQLKDHVKVAGTAAGSNNLGS
ncbi:DUF1000-domain-containing protein [Tilletiaria anomala UBC 951]|uniref:DUF1000-domain-containing protein n=1 Tax=Tilletiaria anomala (strain ATCC 24038 / CBS 436.72 / UBC 951) TaxID=1037660 RepID=A0A066VLA1_TILAU|nr:DUF1000-domain-containing protein [Tilletiaria anomala UBC 951]KDN41078.1 DUF1000-domain-containing protein [Tilletiaria anomala UBC 951]